MLDGTKLIAEKLPSVSVLFADIVGFTKLSQRITPEQLVEGLDKIFSAFDTLAEKYGLEKIKTIGDAYMVVAGAPEKREDHANAMAEFALEMVEAMKEFSSQSTGEQIQLRIGIHSGEVVAGVIGKKKFAYDLWGDAVNTASRMESHGEAGRIHCSSEFTEELLRTVLPAKAGIHFAERGELEIKGKGKMRTYFLEIA
jgi:class 3 adenylate cyclase